MQGEVGQESQRQVWFRKVQVWQVNENKPLIAAHLKKTRIDKEVVSCSFLAHTLFGYCSDYDDGYGVGLAPPLVEDRTDTTIYA